MTNHGDLPLLVDDYTYRYLSYSHVIRIEEASAYGDISG